MGEGHPCGEALPNLGQEDQGSHHGMEGMRVGGEGQRRETGKDWGGLLLEKIPRESGERLWWSSSGGHPAVVTQFSCRIRGAASAAARREHPAIDAKTLHPGKAARRLELQGLVETRSRSTPRMRTWPAQKSETGTAFRTSARS